MSASFQPHDLVSSSSVEEFKRYEMELINCIKLDYPIIYKEIKGMSASLRASKMRSAWKKIAKRFKNCPFKHHQATWRNINLYYMNRYLKPKYKGAFPIAYEDTLALNAKVPKYLDGTLSFLEEEFLKEEKKRPQLNTSKKRSGSMENLGNPSGSNHSEATIARFTKTNPTGSLEAQDSVVMPQIKEVTSLRNIEHQETTVTDTIDLNSTGELDEAGETLPKKTGVSSSTSRKVWNEEELLNATRVTQAMIKELIRIKCRDTKADVVVDLE